jgi:hypothetical protein
MFLSLIVLGAAAFALITADASRSGGSQLIARRPYENVRTGMPRTARCSTVIDL